MGRPIKRQFFGFKVPLTTQGIGKKQKQKTTLESKKVK